MVLLVVEVDRQVTIEHVQNHNLHRTQNGNCRIAKADERGRHGTGVHVVLQVEDRGHAQQDSHDTAGYYEE